MSEKIDYDAYLKQLGDVNTNQIEAIKKYLEEQIKDDTALSAVYKPEKLDDCYRFIYKTVEKMKRTENCACIDEAIVYKMARDYFIEILPTLKDEKAEEKPVDITPAQETVKEVAEQVESDAASDNVKHDYCGFEVFGEETEEPEESEEETAEEPCDQDEVGEEEKVLQPVASDTPKYDEEGNGLLFDF